MKKHFIVLNLSMLLFVSCKLSNEEKAKKLINEELKTTMNDYKSYEAVKFGNIDSVYSTFNESGIFKDDDIKWKIFYDSAEFYLKLARESLSSGNTSFKRYLLIANSFNDSIKVFMEKEEKDSINFKPKFSSWAMEHSFRGKNGMGNLIINHYMFYFDSSLTKVLKSIDVSESALKLKENK